MDEVEEKCEIKGFNGKSKINFDKFYKFMRRLCE